MPIQSQEFEAMAGRLLIMTILLLAWSLKAGQFSTELNGSLYRQNETQETYGGAIKFGWRDIFQSSEFMEAAFLAISTNAGVNTYKSFNGVESAYSLEIEPWLLFSKYYLGLGYGSIWWYEGSSPLKSIVVGICLRCDVYGQYMEGYELDMTIDRLFVRYQIIDKPVVTTQLSFGLGLGF